MTINDLDRCSNCGACVNACPTKAISVNRDNVFYEPVIDGDKCIRCGKCFDVCPVKDQHGAAVTSPISAYAGWHNNSEIVSSSSSGGAFFGIAEYIIANGGIVFGAVYSDDSKEVLFKSTDEVCLSALQKSKYVESLVSDTFTRIKDILKTGRLVLFCGTPCQVAGLKNYLHEDYENLLTCDFACGGLPSHRIYRDYLSYLESKYGSKIKKIDFRPKTYGWKRYAIFVEFENGKVYDRLGVEDPYLKSFLYGKLSVRDYCLECDFSLNHYSDITIADFWLHGELTEMDNNNGISLILCNTEKGASSVDKICDSYVLEEIDPRKASYNVKKEIYSQEYVNKHRDFLKSYDSNGLKKTYKIFLSNSLKKSIKYRITRYFFDIKRGKK